MRKFILYLALVLFFVAGFFDTAFSQKTKLERYKKVGELTYKATPNLHGISFYDATIDNNGDCLYVVNSEGKVIKFDSTGQLVPVQGVINDSLNPFSIPLSGSNIRLVRDGQANFIFTVGFYLVKYDSLGNLLVKRSLKSNVTAIAVDKMGNLFTVSDSVRKFNSNGIKIKSWSKQTSLAEKAITVLSNNDVIVYYANSNNEDDLIMLYNEDGQKIDSIVSPQKNLSSLVKQKNTDNVYLAFQDTVSIKLLEGKLISNTFFRTHAYGSVDLSFLGQDTIQPYYASSRSICESSKYFYIVKDYSIEKLYKNGNLKTQWGLHGALVDTINQVKGICFDSKSNIYVSTGESIVKYDSNYTFLNEWGIRNVQQSKGLGKFQETNKVVCSDSDKLWVFDSYTGPGLMQLFNTYEGRFLKQVEGGWQPTNFTEPRYLETNHSKLYCLDQGVGYSKVKTFDSSWTYISTFEPHAPSIPYFQYFNGFAIDSKSNFYLSAYFKDNNTGYLIDSSCVVETYDSTGMLLNKLHLDRKSSIPEKLDIDKWDNLYVAYQDTIYKYSKSGTLVSKIAIEGVFCNELKVNNDGVLFSNSSGGKIDFFELQPSLEVYKNDTLLHNNIFSFQFPSTIEDSTSKAVIFKVKNSFSSSPSQLCISEIYLEGGNSEQFIVNASSINQTSLGQGDSAFFNILFKPNAVGEFSTSLKIITNDEQQSPFLIHLSGTGLSGTVDYDDKMISLPSEYTVFPNPSKGFFQINCTQNSVEKIVLTDIYGNQEIHDKNKIQTNLKGLLIGNLYTKSGKRETFKLIIIE